MREFLFLTIANYLPRLSWSDKIRYLFLRMAGMKIEKSTIWGPVVVRPLGGVKNITIGAGTFLNTETRFGVPSDKVTIGKNVQIGPRVSFETVNHGLKFIPGRGRGAWTKPITILDEVWIGAGSIILQGVTIGRGSVVACGSVVSKDVPPGVIVGGVPAKIIRKIEDEDVSQF